MSAEVHYIVVFFFWL